MGSARRVVTSIWLWAIVAVIATASASPTMAAEGEEVIPYSRSGADTCLGCHDDSAKVLSIFQNKHAQRGDHRAPFGEGGLQCEACHGPGGDHSRRPRRGEERASMPYWGHASTASTEELNGVCLTCHENHVGLKWAGSAHDVEDLE